MFNTAAVCWLAAEWILGGLSWWGMEMSFKEATAEGKKGIRGMHPGKLTINLKWSNRQSGAAESKKEEES